MESHGLPGKVQITQATYELLKDEFVCEPRGCLEVKGMGEVDQNGNGVQDEGDRFFLCPLLGPGRPTP